MDKAGNHHTQQTDTRTGKQTPRVLNHKWELNDENTWTQRGEQHTPGPVVRWGMRKENLEDWSIGTANHYGTHTPTYQTCAFCTCIPFFS